MNNWQDSPWQRQPAMDKPTEIGPQADQKKRKMLAQLLMSGTQGGAQQPDVFQMYKWSQQ
jgi:hypothetical protein